MREPGMDVFDVIRKERTAGKLFCGATTGVKSVAALATAFGLKGDASLYHQVDAEMARSILVGVLHRDLAYGNRLLSLARAEELAGEVMQLFAAPGIRFLTNAQFKQGTAAGLVMSHWDPATDATFDTGVLMLGTGDSGCLWVADED
jgi:hypothetical protein